MKKVATHSGSFHADDVFAMAILRLCFDDVKVIRTRDPDEFNAADMRVDVGMKYDPKTHDYDHHQPEGAGERYDVPYAAAGLVWKHFGRDLTENDDAFEYVEQKIIMPIDAADNGVSTFEVTSIAPFTIQDAIKVLNPGWTDTRGVDTLFDEAVGIATMILKKTIERANGLVKADKLVREAIKNSPKDYVILETFCPWKKRVIEESEAKFAIYPSMEGNWNVQGVPLAEEKFEVRASLPEEWAGLTGEELAKVSGVDDAVFCHRKRFIAAARSKKGALEMVKKALRQ